MMIADINFNVLDISESLSRRLGNLLYEHTNYSWVLSDISSKYPGKEVYGDVPEVELTREVFEELTGISLINRNGTSKVVAISRFMNRILALPVDLQNAIFDVFDTYHRRTVEIAVEAGTLDMGIRVLNVDDAKVIEKRLANKHYTGAQTDYVKLEVRTRIEPTRFEEADRGFVDQSAADMFVYNRISKRIYAIQSKNVEDDPNGNKRVRRRGVFGKKPTPMYASDLENPDNYEIIYDVGNAKKYNEKAFERARVEWDKQVAEAAEFEVGERHFVVGAILPVWGSVDMKRGRVYRFRTETGDDLLGKEILESDIDETLRNLGISPSAPTLSPEAIMQQMHDDRMSEILLDNGMSIKTQSVKLGDKPRRKMFVVDGVGPEQEEEFIGYGIEKVLDGMIEIYFIPNGTVEESVEVFEKFMKESGRKLASFTYGDGANRNLPFGPNSQALSMVPSPLENAGTITQYSKMDIRTTTDKPIGDEEPISRQDILEAAQRIFGLDIRSGLF